MILMLFMCLLVVETKMILMLFMCLLVVSPGDEDDFDVVYVFACSFTWRRR